MQNISNTVPPLLCAVMESPALKSGVRFTFGGTDQPESESDSLGTEDPRASLICERADSPDDKPRGTVKRLISLRSSGKKTKTKLGAMSDSKCRLIVCVCVRA